MFEGTGVTWRWMDGVMLRRGAFGRVFASSNEAFQAATANQPTPLSVASPRSFDPANSLISLDLTRLRRKYASRNAAFAFNLAASPQHMKRHESLLTHAQELEKRQSGAPGSVGLTDYYSAGQDAMYFGKITIGTPAQVGPCSRLN